MEKHVIDPNLPPVCRVGLGTWAMGGWMWGGTDEKVSIRAIHASLNAGINLIDTAPVYGFGKSEEIVGKALKSYGKRDQVVVATKAGLKWEKSSITRDCSRARILKEVDDSLCRLQLDWIDIYQIHWPDLGTPLEETALVMRELLEMGKIRAIGVSNFTPEMIATFSRVAPVHVAQPPYNLFERGIEGDLLPYCKKEGISMLGYGVLCRGLLSGRMTASTTFTGDDLRKIDPKFQQPLYGEYLACVERLKERFQRPVGALAIRWALDKGIDVPLLGLRRPEQLDLLEAVWGWSLSDEDCAEIEEIVAQTISAPVGPEFMSPPSAT